MNTNQRIGRVLVAAMLAMALQACAVTARDSTGTAAAAPVATQAYSHDIYFY